MDSTRDASTKTQNPLASWRVFGSEVLDHLTRHAKKWNPLHDQNYIHASQLVAAVLVGLTAFLFAKVITQAQGIFTREFRGHPLEVCLTEPFLFLAAAWLVIRFAPEAKGSGIPQVLKAIEETSPQNPRALSGPLVSLKTAAVKFLSTTIGILGGASVGREGPTVQIASSLFAGMARMARRHFGLQDLRSFLDRSRVQHALGRDHLRPGRDRRGHFFPVQACGHAFRHRGGDHRPSPRG